MGLMFLMAACTSDVVEPVVSPEQGGSSEKPSVEKPSAPLEGVMSLMSGFDEPYTRGMTRAWLPPTGFELYDVGEGKSFSVFFTQDPDPAPAEPYEEEFFFRSSGKWRVSKTDLKNETYYLYGYAPRDYSANVTATIAPDESGYYEEGAVLTLSNLPTATVDDVCVIIGAKNGKDYYSENADYTVPPLVAGDFEYEAQPTSEGSGGTGNYVYLLLDHLYASLDISMKVHSEYDALRTIKLKKLHLQTSTDLGSVKKKTNVTITLRKTTDGSSPIAKDGEGKELITFTPTGDEVADLNMAPEEGKVLSTAPEDFIGYFMPEGVKTLVLTSTYDVYDKNTSPAHPEGNLVRQDCRATNTIEFSRLFYLHDQAVRGKKYHVTMTIKPTYLYVMSEPDLNNPTVVIN